MLDEVLQTIRRCRPLAFLMEESDRVATYERGIWWQSRVAELESMQYHVKWSILNAAHHGVPQNRPRLWVVGLRHDCPGRPDSFTMPEPLPLELRMALSSILAPPSDRDDPRALPKAAGAQANVLLVKERAGREGITGDWACAQGLSRRWGAKAAPRLVMPCFLHNSSPDREADTPPWPSMPGLRVLNTGPTLSPGAPLPVTSLAITRPDAHSEIVASHPLQLGHIGWP